MKLFRPLDNIRAILIKRLKIFLRLFRKVGGSGRQVQTIAATERGSRRVRNVTGYLKERQYDGDHYEYDVCLPHTKSVFLSGNRPTSTASDTKPRGIRFDMGLKFVKGLPHDFVINLLVAFTTLMATLVLGWALSFLMDRMEVVSWTRGRKNRKNDFHLSRELLKDLETEVSFHSLFDKLEKLGYDIHIEHKEATSVSSNTDEAFIRRDKYDKQDSELESSNIYADGVETSDNDTPLIDIISSVLEHYKVTHDPYKRTNSESQGSLRGSMRTISSNHQRRSQEDLNLRKHDIDVENRRQLTPTTIPTSSGSDIIHLRKLTLSRQSENDNRSQERRSLSGTRNLREPNPLLDISNLANHYPSTKEKSDSSFINLDNDSNHESLVTNFTNPNSEIVAKKVQNLSATPVTPNIDSSRRSSRLDSQENRYDESSMRSIQTTPSYLKPKTHIKEQLTELSEDFVQGRRKKGKLSLLTDPHKNRGRSLTSRAAFSNESIYYSLKRTTKDILLNDDVISFQNSSVTEPVDLDEYAHLEELIEESNNMTLVPKKWVEIQLKQKILDSDTEEKINNMKKLRAIFSYDFDGDNDKLKSLINQYKLSTGKNLLRFIAFLSSENIKLSETVILLIQDYMTFSDSQKISVSIYKACVNRLIAKIGLNDDLNLLISRCLFSMVIALDYSMLEKTLFEILDESLEERWDSEKITILLKCIKYYMCFNKRLIVSDFIVNPFESKIHCNGSKLIKNIERKIPKIVEICVSTKITSEGNKSESEILYEPLLEELIEIFLTIVEIFINTDEISPSIQYELLTNHIKGMYNRIRQVADSDSKILEPPTLKELMPKSRDLDEE